MTCRPPHFSFSHTLLIAPLLQTLWHPLFTLPPLFQSCVTHGLFYLFILSTGPSPLFCPSFLQPAIAETEYTASPLAQQLHHSMQAAPVDLFPPHLSLLNFSATQQVSASTSASKACPKAEQPPPHVPSLFLHLLRASSLICRPSDSRHHIPLPMPAGFGP